MNKAMMRDSLEDMIDWELVKDNTNTAVAIVNHGVEFVAKELMFAFSPIMQAADTDEYDMNEHVRRNSSVEPKRNAKSKTKPRPDPESLEPGDLLVTDRQASGEPNILNVEDLDLEEYLRSILKEGEVNDYDLNCDPRTKPEINANDETIDSGSDPILPVASKHIFRTRLHAPVDDHPNEFRDLVRMQTVNYVDISSRPAPFPEMQNKRGTKPIPIMVRPIPDRTDTKGVHDKGQSSFEIKRKNELQEMRKSLDRQSSRREQQKRTEIRQGAILGLEHGCTRQDHEMLLSTQEYQQAIQGNGNVRDIYVEEKRSESHDTTRALETISPRQGHEQHSGRRENTHTAELRETKFISVKERKLQYEQQQLEGWKHRGHHIPSGCEEIKTVEQKLQDKNRQAKELISQMCYEQPQHELLQRSHGSRSYADEMREIEKYYRA
jgi:hypothetical protein